MGWGKESRGPRRRGRCGGEGRTLGGQGPGWTWDPLVLGALAFAGLSYLRGARRREAGPGQAAAFLGGLAAVFAALVSPIHEAGDRYLFTFHVVQHMLLQMVAPVLLVLGLPPAWVTALGQHRRAGPLLRSPLFPILAPVAYNGVIALWHWPLPGAALGVRGACGIGTDVASQTPLLATAEHGLPLAAGLAFWAAVLLPRWVTTPSVVTRAGLLLAAWVFNWVVSFVHAFAGSPFYGTYLVLPRLGGLDPLSDQLLGAGIMWEHGSMTYGLALVIQVWRVLRGGGAPGSAPGGTAGAAGTGGGPGAVAVTATTTPAGPAP